jgi:hypothetical protein
MMKRISWVIAFCLMLHGYGFSQKPEVKMLLKEIPPVTSADRQTQIMFLGTTHFGQEAFYKQSSMADLFQEGRQKEISGINQQLKKYNPDIIMIERSPDEQQTLDSLYGLFKTGKIKLKDIGYGRAEEFQFGYQLAKELNLRKLFGVDYYMNVSARILSEGENIDLFRNAMAGYGNIGRKVDSQFTAGKLSLKDYLLFLNAPQVYDWTFKTLFIIPAKVRNGRFSKPPVEYIDTSHTNPQYIGAEYISLFYGRELKIYSNIVTAQLREKGKRILVIMGQRHTAALAKIFENDADYKIIQIADYLK